MAKKKETPVFVVIEIPKWKNNLLRFICRLMMIEGKPWVITINNTDLIHNGNNYLNKKTKNKINV